MTVQRQVVRYQGLFAKGVQYSRTDGLDPDPGWVLLRMRDVKRVLIRQFDFGDWRGSSGFEVDGAIDIRAFNNRKGFTVSTPRELARDPAGGLNHFGRLKFDTFLETGAKLPRVEYVDVYVDDAGLEDMGQGLAEQRKHNTGDLFVPLTDVRKYYKEFGPFFGRINVRRPDGTWEEGSVRGPNDPWPADIVIRFLFSQLPGSPVVRTRSPKKNTLDDTSLFLDPPTDVIGAGEPAYEWLTKILDELGMVAKFQPDQTYLVVRGGGTIKYDRIAIAPGKTRKPTFLHAEAQTVTLSSRPENVLVRGKMRIRRTTEPCVAVLRDDDGLIRGMRKVLLDFNYPLLRVAINCIASPETAFEDVPPKPVDIETFRLHKKRRDMLKQMAFKAYAPNGNFALRKAPDDFILDPVLARERLAPIRNFGLYLSEFATLGRRNPSDSEKLSGDRGPFIVAEPIVRAARFTETVFTDFKEIDARFKFLIGQLRDSITYWNDLINQWKRKGKKYGEFLLRSAQLVPTSYKKLKDLAEYKTRSGQSAKFVNLDDDVNRLAGLTDSFGGINHKILIEDMTKLNFHVVDRIKALVANERFGFAKIKELNEAIRVMKGEFKTFFNAWVDTGGVVLVGNEPYGIVPEGEYTIERDTGLITFKEVAGHMRRPFVLDTETPEDSLGLVIDGQVTMTFGHEFRTGTVLDWTAVYITSKTVGKKKVKITFEKGKLAIIAEPIPGKDVIPIVVGLARPSPLKPKLAIAPEMVLYEADEGTPMNLTSVVTEAVQRAGGQVTAPGSATGFTYVMSGFHVATLDVGVSTVQIEWPVQRDRGRAHTTVATNSPFARGLLAGVPNVRRVQAFKAKAREIMIADVGNTP